MISDHARRIAISTTVAHYSSTVVYFSTLYSTTVQFICTPIDCAINKKYLRFAFFTFANLLGIDILFKNHTVVMVSYNRTYEYRANWTLW